MNRKLENFGSDAFSFCRANVIRLLEAFTPLIDLLDIAKKLKIFEIEIFFLSTTHLTLENVDLFFPIKLTVCLYLAATRRS